MRLRYLSTTMLGVFGLMYSAHARYGEGIWFYGELGLGGIMESTTQINPVDGLTNSGLQESNKTGFGTHLDAGASWYLSQDFVADASLGYMYTSVSGSAASTGAQSVSIKHDVGVFTLAPRYRFGDLGKYQLGFEYQMLFGTDTSYSEREGQKSGASKPIANYLGLQFIYDLPSATEKMIYRLGIETSTCISEPRRIIMANLIFEVAMDFLGGGRHYRREEPADYRPRNRYNDSPIEEDLQPEPGGLMPEEPVAAEPPPPAPAPAPLPVVDPDAVTAVATGSVVSIHFPGDRFQFATGMSHIGSKETRAYLHDLGVFLAQNQNFFATGLIVGHTDRRGPKGREREVNMELSEARARTVYNALVDAGVDASKLKSEGRAFDQPVRHAPDNAKGWKLNRRVELSFTGVKNPDQLVTQINELNKRYGYGPQKAR